MTIKTDYSKTFSYARMQNGVQAVRSITFKNPEDQTITDAHLTVKFDPALSEGYSTVLSEIPAKGKMILDNVGVFPSASFLANLTETIQGTMTVTCEAKGMETVSENYPVSLHPYDFWEGINSGGLLANFVLPNHPAVKPILQRASAKLGQWTGNPSLNAYLNANPNEVKKQMAAIYDALREKGIAYANPPASFAQQGQRIRLPEDILSSGIATCLDAALLYAGCLEASGLRPIVVLNEGHAYAGAWLIEKSSPYPVNDDPTILRKNSADGIDEILLVETTGFLKGYESPFDSAVAAADTTLLDIDSFLMFIDVCSARNMGLLPIPQRILTPEGYVIDEKTIYDGGIPARIDEADSIDVDKPAKVDRHIIWERKLLDLSLRNNLVNIHTKKGSIQLAGAGAEMVVEMLEDGIGFKLFGIPTGWNGEMGDAGIFREIAPTDAMYSFAQKEAKD